MRTTPSCRDRPVSKAAGPRPRHHLTPAGLGWAHGGQERGKGSAGSPSATVPSAALGLRA